MKRALSWYLAGLCWLLAVGMVAGTVAAGRYAYANWVDKIFIADFNGLILLSTLVTATVGTLLAERIPRNPIGWLFCLLALSFASDNFTVAYLAVYQPDPAPLAVPVAFAWAILGTSVITAFVTLTFLLFPTGRPPSRRWRFAVWISAIVIALVFIHDLFATEYLWTAEAGASVRNPLQIGALADVYSRFKGLAPLAVVGLFLLSVLSLLLRFRHSRQTERLQIKWLAYSASLALVAGVVALALTLIPGMQDTHLFDVIFFFGLLINFSLVMPIAIGFAVLRYRLFDIDRLINRTLVYGLLTATLLATYFGLVLGLETLVRASTGETSPVVIAASTLAVAALFRPLRSRVQAAVDRRFYRRKYDAERILEMFNARLRDEVDLGMLAADLQGTVRDALGPAHLSLWLKSVRHEPERR